MEDYGPGVVQNYLELDLENHLPGLDEMDIDNLDEWIDYDGGNGPQIVNTGAINLFPNVMDNPETIDPQLLFNWDPNQAGTATPGEQLATFLRGEGHPNPHRRPTLWIQNTPTKVNDWYLSSQKSTRCRYDGCPAKKNTIAQGYFRIAFDEFSHYTGERLNPYHNAGYIHLDCFEEIFDLGYLIHFGADRLRIRIRPDTREFYLQDSNPASLTRNYESMIDMYDEWVAGQRDRAQQLEARNAGVIAYTGLEPPLNRPGNEHENRLGCKLTDHHLSKQPKIRKKVRDERGGVTISDHRGSLRKQMKLRREKRDGNNHRTPGTQGTPAPNSNGNGSGSASQEGSPDLMPGDERFRILLRRRMEPLRLRHERETQELEQRHTQERQELERQILGEYQQEQQQSQLETQQGPGMQNKRPRPSDVDGGEKEEDEDQERTPKRPRRNGNGAGILSGEAQTGTITRPERPRLNPRRSARTRRLLPAPATAQGSHQSGPTGVFPSPAGGNNSSRRGSTIIVKPYPMNPLAEDDPSCPPDDEFDNE
ncbi:hypothetical protein B0J18DRAFT_478538 [Chaetomium sp. MPI-SDFR-AT-0129]|nr:hypothetical protein B0J18DRAFT_478538 [Chaetomium sp. MPI-SDFR-AT-0129]